MLQDHLLCTHQATILINTDQYYNAYEFSLFSIYLKPDHIREQETESKVFPCKHGECCHSDACWFSSIQSGFTVMYTFEYIRVYIRRHKVIPPPNFYVRVVDIQIETEWLSKALQHERKKIERNN